MLCSDCPDLGRCHARPRENSTISRFLVLAFARVTNYAILLVSPIVFVRILDQHAYGQYREFVVYAIALATVLGFSVKTSILYFIPKDPDNERKYVTQTALFIFASSALGLGIVYATRHSVTSSWRSRACRRSIRPRSRIRSAKR